MSRNHQHFDAYLASELKAFIGREEIKSFANGLAIMQS